jgi:ABC-type antimicrobial peptide transport system permease subunit
MIDHRETFVMAFENLLAHKFRSILTVLGIVVGVSVVIVIASLLSGLKASIATEIENLGANNIFASHLDSGLGGGGRRRMTREMRMRKPLTVEDGIAIKEQCPSVQDVAWIGYPTSTRVTLQYKGNTARQADFLGVSYSYSTVYNLKLANGRFFTELEDTHRMPVAVIGPDTAEALFANSDPIGKPMLIQGHPFTVLGVAEKTKLGSMIGQADNYVYIPYGAFHKMMPWEDFRYLFIQAKSGLRAQAMDEAESILRRRRDVKRNEPDNFSLTTADVLAKQLDQLTAMVGVIAIAISSVGLLVGGIGVMNIMLVSVTERTREIGVRKAIGATKRDIVLQFLFEAMTLTGIGGVFGIILAIALSLIVIALIPSLPAAVPMWAVITGLTVSVAIGLIFGVWPARKAAMLDPIEALRYE